ncbi:plexin domain-containing protein 1-like isoform X2 [Dunckerocampus dactyliophorus]|uniref:plexin domain-containing protein 1-like isoform X2 n=1 Tax=Dunckerocampus dactyliophorus TaxID=161453 RepID=UPI0024060A0F|nr:plexin domain-containing protein 1-like isoform X2 [Dunckerocampus dactyliophorus]
MELGGLLFVCLLQAQLGTFWTGAHEDVKRGTPWGTPMGAPSLPGTSLSRGARSAPSQGGRLDISFLPDNMTQIVDSQRYYSWQSFGPEDERTKDLWVDLDSLHKSQVRIHGILSNAHRQAARVALSFDFPFYGHYLRQIIVATGGFIFMGEITHRMLTATQYIAPLMANFDPSFSQNSTVRYSDNGNLFVVQWDNVRLKEREAEGAFTFQAALHRNGTVVFNYKEIPVSVDRINSTEHPVKVGLSDAFMAYLPSAQVADAKQRTIYEYHRVEINTTKIISRSAFEFTPLPTCLQHTSCDLCLASNLTSGCGWCNTLQRCSDGIDRMRQEWLDYNCPEEAKGTCEDYNSPEDSTLSYNHSSLSPATSAATELQGESVTRDLNTDPPKHSGITENAAIIAGVVAALLLLVALTLLAVYYINTHPTLAPPFYLMQRRSNSYWPAMKFRNQGCQSGYGEVELGGHEKEGFLEAEQCC